MPEQRRSPVHLPVQVFDPFAVTLHADPRWLVDDASGDPPLGLHETTSDVVTQLLLNQLCDGEDADE